MFLVSPCSLCQRLFSLDRVNFHSWLFKTQNLFFFFFFRACLISLNILKRWKGNDKSERKYYRCDPSPKWKLNIFGINKDSNYQWKYRVLFSRGFTETQQRERGKSIGRKNCSVQAFENFPLIFLGRPPKNSCLKSPKFVWTENRNPDGGLSDFPLTTQCCSYTLFWACGVAP